MNNADVIDTLHTFRRAWFELDGGGSVYLRFGRRAIDGVLYGSLDVASIEVAEAYRRRGVFSAFVAQCEDMARDSARTVVYFECIHNPIVSEALARRGYTVRGAAPEWTAYKRVLDD